MCGILSLLLACHSQLQNPGNDAPTIIDVAAEMQRRLGGGGGGTPPVHTVGMQDMVDLATQEGALRRLHRSHGATAWAASGTSASG